MNSWHWAAVRHRSWEGMILCLDSTSEVKVKFGPKSGSWSERNWRSVGAQRSFTHIHKISENMTRSILFAWAFPSMLNGPLWSGSTLQCCNLLWDSWSVTQSLVWFGLPCLRMELRWTEAGYACRAQCGSFPCAAGIWDKSQLKHIISYHIISSHIISYHKIYDGQLAAFRSFPKPCEASCKGSANARPSAT
jgi:hypothetical protein